MLRIIWCLASNRMQKVTLWLRRLSAWRAYVIKSWHAIHLRCSVSIARVLSRASQSPSSSLALKITVTSLICFALIPSPANSNIIWGKFWHVITSLRFSTIFARIAQPSSINMASIVKAFSIHKSPTELSQRRHKTSVTATMRIKLVSIRCCKSILAPKFKIQTRILFQKWWSWMRISGTL